jgi:hypothetical protein
MCGQGDPPGCVAGNGSRLSDRVWRAKALAAIVPVPHDQDQEGRHPTVGRGRRRRGWQGRGGEEKQVRGCVGSRGQKEIGDGEPYPYPAHIDQDQDAS